MRFLLDSNVVIALSDVDHVAHSRAMDWFEQNGGLFATCPITQGSLFRATLRLRPGNSIQKAKILLARVEARAGHEFWPDTISYLDLPEAGIRGHKQVTDGYLVALARHHHGRLATLDRALAAIHSDVAVLIP